MKVKLIQLEVDHDIKVNKAKILSAVNNSDKDEWLVFPECVLTGYFPEEESFLQDTSPEFIDDVIEEIRELVKSKQTNCLLGTARKVGDSWYNSVVIINAEGGVSYYDKIALSDLDKKHFSTGSDLGVYKIGDMTFGVQICRELVFPGQWLKLKQQGAQIIFHVNNAIKPYDKVWEHLVIARAVENQLFVASSNNCSEPSELTSYLVSPAGEILRKAERQKEQAIASEVDLVNYISPY